MAGKKVVVVDDDLEIADFVQLSLSTAGYQVLQANDGRAGLELVRHERPDLVLLDLAMPMMHGFEVCQAIRADQSLAGVKIIITSGKSYAVDVRTAKDAGADHYMVKPFGLDQLLDTVGRFLAA